MQNLDHIAGAYGRQARRSARRASVRTRLQNSKMDDIFQSGLHEFIDVVHHRQQQARLGDHAAVSGLTSAFGFT